MSILVTVHLGPAASLTSRLFKVTRHAKAGDDTMPTPTVNETLAGDVETVSFTVPANQIWRIELTDTRLSGEVSELEILYFHTGSLQFPGPRQQRINILSMEECSSASGSQNVSAGRRTARLMDRRAAIWEIHPLKRSGSSNCGNFLYARRKTS